jgi:pilus assembly protein FimV
MDNLIAIVAGLVILLVAVFALIKLRGRGSGGSTADLDDFNLDVEEEAEADAQADAGFSSTEPTQQLDDLESMLESLEEDAGGADEVEAELDEVAEESAAEEAAPETGDAISEADIYINFGTYDKAESLLASAISSEPDRTDLKLKLMQVHVMTGNLAGFDEQYSALQSLGDESAIAQAADLRHDIDGADEVPPPGGDAAVAEEPADDFDLDLDLDEDSGEDEGLGLDLDLEVEETPAEEPAEEFDLDLDLDSDLEEVAPAADVEEDAGGEFDLDLSDELDPDVDDDATAERQVFEPEPEPEPEPAPEPEAELDLEEDIDLDLSGDLEEALSSAPTAEHAAVDISESPTEVSPAVQVSGAKTETREELSDEDLSSLADEIADDAPTEENPVVDAPIESASPTQAEDEALVEEDLPTPVDTELDDEFDFLADADEAATKLDLARAYIDMGDKDGARDILEEVMEEGQEAQKSEAQELLDSLG